VVYEVDVHEEVGFPLSKKAFHSKEAAVERLGAGAIDCCCESRPVFRSECAYFDAASVAQCFNRRISGCVDHGWQAFGSTDH
jgi:hypothetical protein